MKVIIAGCRWIDDPDLIQLAVEESKFEITEVVSGKCRGVDLLGEKWAQKNDTPVVEFPAQWDLYGKRAAYLRNAQMAEYADALVAIWDGESKGTSMMINLAKKAGIKVYVMDVRYG